jgi:hypothetical protein
MGVQSGEQGGRRGANSSRMSHATLSVVIAPASNQGACRPSGVRTATSVAC